MALDYVATSQKIVDAVGGAGNIASASHCMTRLRLVLNDEGKANDDAVKAIKGVKSVIKQGMCQAYVGKNSIRLRILFVLSMPASVSSAGSA